MQVQICKSYTQFAKAKSQFTTDIRFLHGFEKLVLGWAFIDIWIERWFDWPGWCGDSVISHVAVLWSFVSDFDDVGVVLLLILMVHLDDFVEFDCFPNFLFVEMIE